METTAPAQNSVLFTGRRAEFASMLLRGYALMIPTIGLNRFWLTTRKRRFYWGNTEIGGDALEYTGNAQQLLLGFLMAVAVFLPIYGVFFFLSTQSVETTIIGYGVVAVGIWFLTGYAQYRGRDFRLSRTLWRGIRFDQTGSAWGYAIRRFLWSLFNLATLGLVYPFMASKLWSYRYRHTWYGNRQFGFTGTWKKLALPYYCAWLVGAALATTALVVADQGGLIESIDNYEPDGGAILNILGIALAIGLVVTFYRAAEMTRMFSSITLGAARLRVRIGALNLLWLYILFSISLVLAYFVLAVGGSVVLTTVAAEAFAGGEFDFDVLMRSMQSSVLALLAIIFGYLLIVAAFSWTHELFIGFGFWRLICKSATVSDLASLDDVRARDEDKALAGEGLADALNVGGY